MGKNRCSCCDDIYSVRKDFIRGGVDESDFADEFRHISLKKKTKKSRPRSETRQPCPVAEDGKHVYVWVGYESDYGNDKIFYEYFGYYRSEILRCCGCNVSKGYGRESERYMKTKEHKWRKLTGGEFAVKRGEPVSRRRRWGGNFYSYSWEREDPGYMSLIKAKEEREKTAWLRWGL